VARTLTVARVRVRPGREAEYLAAIRALAALAEPRGRRLWVFRCAGDPALFLECSESRDRDHHRATADLPEDERQLERKIRAAAEPGPDQLEIWEAIE